MHEIVPDEGDRINGDEVPDAWTELARTRNHRLWTINDDVFFVGKVERKSYGVNPETGEQYGDEGVICGIECVGDTVSVEPVQPTPVDLVEARTGKVYNTLGITHLQTAELEELIRSGETGNLVFYSCDQMGVSAPVTDERWTKLQESIDVNLKDGDFLDGCKNYLYNGFIRCYTDPTSRGLSTSPPYEV